MSNWKCLLASGQTWFAISILLLHTVLSCNMKTFHKMNPIWLIRQLLFLYNIINVSISLQIDILPSTNEDAVYKNRVLNSYDHRHAVIFFIEYSMAELIWRIQDDPIWNAFMTIRTSKYVKINMTQCLEWDFQTIKITL